MQFVLLVIDKTKEISFLRGDLKMLMEGADGIAIGKEFQSLRLGIEKALSPKRILCASSDTIALYPSQERRFLESYLIN